MRKSAKESKRQADKIRKLWATKKYTISDLANKFNIAKQYCELIVKNKKCIVISKPKGVWKDIELDGVLYSISNDGRVWSYARNREIDHKTQGYKCLYVGNRPRKRYRVHRLVLTLFKRKPRPGEIARHLDDDKQNNHISNLAWGYHEDNCNDALRNECYAKGADVGSAKLTEKQVKKFAEAYKRGYSGSMKGYCIAMKEKMKLNVSIKQLLSILKGTYWSHITGITSYEKKFSVKLDEKSVRFIHKRYAKLKNKYTQADICRRLEKFLATKGYEVSWRTIKKALNGHSFKSIYNEFNK